MSKTTVIQRQKVKTFSYKSSPRNVTVKLDKTRYELKCEDVYVCKTVTFSTQIGYGNIMYDRRVVRGNTWAMRRIAQVST